MIEGTPRFLSFRRKNHGWEEGKEKKGWTWRKEKERKKRKEIHDESVLESFASRPISIQSFSRIDATYFIWTITSDVRPHIEIWFLKTCYVGGCGRRRPLSTTRENLQCTCRFSDLYTEFENRFTNGKGYETCYFQRVCPTYKLAAIYGQPAPWWLEWVVNLDDCSLVLHLPSTRNFTLKRWPTSEKFWEIFSYLTTFSL